MRENKKEDILLACLKENWKHARHQERQREHCNTLYWTAWGAGLVFVYSGRQTTGDFFSDSLQYPWLFLFLALLTLPTLAGTLKWTAEFGNHVAAAAEIAKALELNKDRGNAKTYLPYNEFTGYMALPLKMPQFLNVGIIMAALQCVGGGLAVWVFTNAVGIQENNGVWPFRFGVAYAIILLIFAGYAKSRMDKEISNRRVKLSSTPSANSMPSG